MCILVYPGALRSIPVIRRIPVILATGFRSSCQLLSTIDDDRDDAETRF